MGFLRLKGSFDVEIYGEDGKLKRQKSYDNFITSTGLSYPYSMNIEECFRMLSVGSGDYINTVLTTGLSARVASLSNLVNYVDDACGTVETNSGVNYFRAWRVPESNSITSPTGLHLKELGVHPTTLSTGLSGKLFSRVLINETIPSGDYSLITYRLNVGLPTGIKTFAGIINTSLVNSTDSPVCRYWHKISGKYSAIHHGLNLIDVDGLRAEEPIFATPFEPSNTNETALRAYLSTDNKQFLVNSWSGGAIDTGAFRPYVAGGKEFGTGLCRYHNTIDSVVADRLTDMRKDTILIPSHTNFREELEDTAYAKVNTLTTITPETFIATGRTRSLVRLFSWANAQNLFEDGNGNPRSIKSLVLAHTDGSDYKPYCDVIFSTSGYAQLHYQINSGAYTYVTGGPTGYFPFIDPYDNLSLSFRLAWSSSCPDTVSGCPGFVP